MKIPYRKLSRGQRSLLIVIAVGLAVLIGDAEFVSAQDGADTSVNREVDPASGTATESIWQFGLKLSVAGGDATKVTASVPVPIDWPEQTVERIEVKRSDGVRTPMFKDLARGAEVMVFAIAKMPPNSSAEAIAVYRIEKRNTLPPADTSEYRIADPVSGRLKKFLKPSPFIESRDRAIVKIADELAASDEGRSDWEKVEAIYEWVRENVRYEFDTQIHTCVEAIDAGKGDCEELSSLFIAICRARGIPARAVWVPGHTYPEFFMVDDEGEGHWFPCQAAARGMSSAR